MQKNKKINYPENMRKIAKDIIDSNIDIIEGIWKLSALKDVSRELDDLDLMLAGIKSETDDIVFSANKYFYSKELLDSQVKWKEEYVKDMWPVIKKICETILGVNQQTT